VSDYFIISYIKFHQLALCVADDALDFEFACASLYFPRKMLFLFLSVYELSHFLTVVTTFLCCFCFLSESALVPLNKKTIFLLLRACAHRQTHIECFYCVRAIKNKNVTRQRGSRSGERRPKKRGRRRAERPLAASLFSIGTLAAKKLHVCAWARVHAAPSIMSHREIKPSIFCHKPIQYLSGRRFFRPVAVTCECVINDA
jgi:hypothetical protein